MRDSLLYHVHYNQIWLVWSGLNQPQPLRLTWFRSTKGPVKLSITSYTIYRYWWYVPRNANTMFLENHNEVLMTYCQNSLILKIRYLSVPGVESPIVTEKIVKLSCTVTGSWIDLDLRLNSIMTLDVSTVTYTCLIPSTIDSQDSTLVRHLLISWR